LVPPDRVWLPSAPWGAFDAAKHDILRVEQDRDGQWWAREDQGIGLLRDPHLGHDDSDLEHFEDVVLAVFAPLQVDGALMFGLVVLDIPPTADLPGVRRLLRPANAPAAGSSMSYASPRHGARPLPSRVRWGSLNGTPAQRPPTAQDRPRRSTNWPPVSPRLPTRPRAWGSCHQGEIFGGPVCGYVAVTSRASPRAPSRRVGAPQRRSTRSACGPRSL